MKKTYILKEQAKDTFYNSYSQFIEKFEEKGVHLECKPYICRKNILMRVFLKPNEAKKEGCYKNFSAKISKLVVSQTESTTKPILRDRPFERFLQRELKQICRVGGEKACKENLCNLFLRMIYFRRCGGLPKKYKEYNLNVIYVILAIITIAIVEIIYVAGRFKTFQNLGFYP